MTAAPRIVFPATVPDALDELACEDDETVRPLAGGTALMLLMRYGFMRPARLVSLRLLAGELGQITRPADGRLGIGAMVTLTGLAQSPLVQELAGVLAQAAALVANVRVRNVARLGGHLGHADPHMDLPPVLLALDARVAIQGPQGCRSAALDDLVTGYYETSLAQQELITGVEVPVVAGRLAAYGRYTRVADDWPTVCIAAALQVQDGRAARPRIAVSAVTGSPTRLTAAEQLLEGAPLSDATCSQVAEAAAASVHPVDDLHGSAGYKQEMVRVQTRRALRTLFAEHAQAVTG